MSKTIKLIELLNKIANGEEVPEKVKYRGIEYIRIKNTSTDMDYYGIKNSTGLFLEKVTCTHELNEQVEIIEDEIDIQEIEEINHYDIISAVKGKTEENINNELAKHSLIINKLRQAVKQLDKQINNK